MRQDLAMLALFLLLAAVWTWPLASNLSLHIPHDPGDPLLNTWILWWNAHAVPFTARWWSPPIFDPMPGALALSEHLAGIAVFTTPLQWAGVTPIESYNIALLLSFGLSGFFAFLLGRRLTGSTLAGICAGVAFGFAPYRASQLSHLQVLTSQWMPLALLAMHGFVEQGKRRWLAVFAVAWLLQALSNGYFLLFFPVLIMLWLAWFVDWRAAPRRGVALAATWAASSLLLVPALLHYRHVQRGLGLARSSDEMMRFSARLDSFVHPARLLAFWPTWPGETQEEFLFPGITAVALMLAAGVAALVAGRGWRMRRSALVFYSAAALLMYLLALGPAASGSALALLRPYTWLTYLPGFNGLRVPARFAMIGVLCLAVSASLAFRRLAPARPALHAAFAVLVLAGLAIDGWMRPLRLVPPPAPLTFRGVTGAAVIELPADVGSVSTAAMYRAMSHGMPLVNGYSGHTPPHYAILSSALKRGDPSVLLEIARGRPLIIVIDDRYDRDGAYRRLVRRLPGIQPDGTSPADSIFVLPAGPLRRATPRGDVLPTTIMEAGHDRALIDLGGARAVAAIQLALRSNYAELPPRLLVETSVDGTTWMSAWNGWTGGPALAGALEDPLETPLRIELSDVPARYIRIEPLPAALAARLEVHGSPTPR